MNHYGGLRLRLTREFFRVGLVYLAGFPLSLLVTIMMARVLGPADYGVLTFVMAILALLKLPPSAGISKLLTREVASCRQAGQWDIYLVARRGAVFWIAIVSALVLGLFGMFFGSELGGLRAQTWSLLLVVVALVPLHGLNVARNGIIRGLGYPTLAVLPGQVLQPVLIVIVVFLLLLSDSLTLYSALYTQLFVGVTIFLIGAAFLLTVKPEIPASVRPRYQWRPWLLAMGPFAVIDFINLLNGHAGVLLIGFLGSDESVAAFRVAERGAYLVALPLMLVNMVISPHLVELHRNGDHHRFAQLVRQSCRGACLLALPAALVLGFFGAEIIELVFGADYVDLAYLPMVILVIGQAINVMLGSVGLLLDMTGLERVSMKGMLLGLMVNILLAIVLIPSMQALGAAIAAATGVVLTNLILGYAVYRNLNVRPGLI